MKKLYKLTPSLHANIWGGNKLRDYGKSSDADRIGESWELSFVPGGEALADGRPLTELFPKGAWGTRARAFENFPTLTKFIDAREKLSVQVHPDDAYAKEHEGGYGKSEMWYVVDADEDAGLYMGFERRAEKSEIEAAIADGSIEGLLSFKKVSPGDVFFIPAGTVHAIGAGVLIFEIQQNSTSTYRLYDYMRRGADGKLRELHVKKALDVLMPDVYTQWAHKEEEGWDANQGKIIGECDYFRVREYRPSGSDIKLRVCDESFLSITAVCGSGSISYEADYAPMEERISRGDTFFAPASDTPYELTVSGDITFITVEI